MKHQLPTIIVIIALLAPVAAWSQTKVKLKNADKLATNHKQANAVDCLKGNVVFVHDKTTIYCDSASFNKKSNSLEAYGNVRMIMNDSTVFTARRLKYNGNTKKADLQAT
jgi:lipopolysaccharide assembly outer membrane protein LptD (OstA)